VLLTNGKTADVILTRNRESASLVLGSCDCVVLLL
jgi:oligo-1,6-glucosidase